MNSVLIEIWPVHSTTLIRTKRAVIGGDSVLETTVSLSLFPMKIFGVFEKIKKKRIVKRKLKEYFN